MTELVEAVIWILTWWNLQGTGNANFYYATAMAFACFQVCLYLPSGSLLLITLNSSVEICRLGKNSLHRVNVTIIPDRTDWWQEIAQSLNTMMSLHSHTSYMELCKFFC